MPGEPKRRHSKARKRTRRSAINITVNSVMCKNCGKPTRPHMVCVACGFYKGKLISKKVQATKA